MQTHANAQIAGRSIGFAHFLELRTSCGKLRPSSGKLRSSCGFVFSRALHQASRQLQKVLELDLIRTKTLECPKLSLFCVSKGPPGNPQNLIGTCLGSSFGGFPVETNPHIGKRGIWFFAISAGEASGCHRFLVLQVAQE